MKAASPDTVLRCENCRRVLVRTSESGLGRGACGSSSSRPTAVPGATRDPRLLGAVVIDAVTGETLAERAEYVGIATNDVAEYRGLVAGLRAAHELDPAARVRVRMNCKLVVEQVRSWKIKHPDMKPLAAEAARVFRPTGSPTSGCRANRTTRGPTGQRGDGRGAARRTVVPVRIDGGTADAGFCGAPSGARGTARPAPTAPHSDDSRLRPVARGEAAKSEDNARAARNVATTAPSTGWGSTPDMGAPPPRAPAPR